MQSQDTRSTISVRALERAMREKIKARRVSPRCWMVTSSDGRREYEVCLDAAIRCQCPAGIAGRECKHVSLVQVLSITSDPDLLARRGGVGLCKVGAA